ncbi:DNA polymerase thumb domain-containing protein [Streptomyces sp. SDr-06]|uniref:DNA polymerase Y family protein n=1 Tax=Streptomyces sp. SDr-06 TaxID=2267702 RepID=UPI001CB94CB5|nr:helix-hairpin-helix domain-containing protein [Streptomyces sp. SDr-06]
MSHNRARCIMRVFFHPGPDDDADHVFGELMSLVENFTPRYQPHPQDLAVDLDLTGALRYLDRTPYEAAQVLALRALALHGVPTTIGAGNSVMIAAMAAAATAPGRITVIDPDPDSVEAFLRPQPTALLPGVGPATARTLKTFGIRTVGELADTPPATLARILGASPARELHALACGIDERPVQRETLIRTTSSTHRFPADELDPAQHHRALLGLAEELGVRLRTAKEVCRALTLTVRYADRTSTTRTRTLTEATAHSNALAHTARDLFASLGLQRARVTAITLRAEGLTSAEHAYQQLLLDPADDKRRRIEAAADAARRKFGPKAVRPASLARRRPSSPTG